MRSMVMPRELRGAPPFVFANRYCQLLHSPVTFMTVEIIDCAYFPANAPAPTNAHRYVDPRMRANQSAAQRLLNA